MMDLLTMMAQQRAKAAAAGDEAAAGVVIQSEAAGNTAASQSGNASSSSASSNKLNDVMGVLRSVFKGTKAGNSTAAASNGNDDAHSDLLASAGRRLSQLVGGGGLPDTLTGRDTAFRLVFGNFLDLLDGGKCMHART